MKTSRPKGLGLPCQPLSLEARVLLDAAGFGTALDQFDASVFEGDGTDYASSSEPPVAVPAVEPAARREIAFVDSTLAADAAFGEALAAFESANRDLQVVRLGAAGVDEIGAILQGYADLGVSFDGVHLLSHGESARLQLGEQSIDLAALEDPATAERIAGWGEALNQGADILIYGCELASGTDGISLVGRLVDLTGADITASDDPTGCLLYTSPSPRDGLLSRMPSSA